MQVSLTEHLEKYVKEKVESGKFNTESEVISQALRLMENDEKDYEYKLNQLREAVHIGDEQLKHGEYSDRTIDDIIRDNEAKINKMNQ